MQLDETTKMFVFSLCTTAPDTTIVSSPAVHEDYEPSYENREGSSPCVCECVRLRFNILLQFKLRLNHLLLIHHVNSHIFFPPVSCSPYRFSYIRCDEMKLPFKFGMGHF